MTKTKPRDYQIEALNLIWVKLHSTADNLLCISPTGTGKTFIINALSKRFLTTYPNTRIMCVTHDKTIIGQNADGMKKYWDAQHVGIYSAGLKKRDTRHRMIYTGIQSVRDRSHEFGKVNILIIDEAHLLSPNEGTSYQKLITGLTKRNPKMRILLFSATPYRLGQGHLLESEFADSIAFDFTETSKFMWFVEQGYLSRLITKKAAKEIDVTDAKMKGGEFDSSDVQRLSNTKENNVAVVEECIRYGSDRKHWMVFAAGVEHGMALAEQFRAYGVTAICLHAKSIDRESELKKWEIGEHRAMINVGLYTTGYDFPALDLIAVARATQSTALWVQMVGRGTRCVYVGNHDLSTQDGRLLGILEGPKPNCLVLDFAGNTRRLGPINCPVIPKSRKKGDGETGEAPVKTCPECDTYNHTRAAVCETCGYEFPPPESVTKEAGTDDVMVEEALEPDLQEYAVLSASYGDGVARSTGREYFRVTYNAFTNNFTKFFHPGFPVKEVRDRFEGWWWSCLEPSDKRLHKTRDSYAFPQSIGEALDRANKELRVPDTVMVDINCKYPDIKSIHYAHER